MLPALEGGIETELILGKNGQFLHDSSPILKFIAESTASADTTATDTVAKKAVCLSVTLRKFGVRRKANTELIDTDADKAMIYLSKDIIDSPELKEIQGLHSEVKAFLKKRALPGVVLKSGLYLLPIGLIEEVDKKLEEMKAKEKILVDEFLGAYPGQVEEAEKRLKGLFNVSDYPTVEKLRTAFGIETQLLSINVPSTLKEINAEIWKKEQEKFELQWQETLHEVREGMREGLAGILSHMVDKLQESPDGKKKRFHASTVEKLKDFLDVFDSRNITSDTDLKEVVEKAKQIVQGVEPDDLRKYKPIRDVVLEGLTQVKAELDSLTTTSNRKYKFNEE